MRDPETFEDLVRLMDRLRDPGGCPWDREQDFSTLRSYLLEECYEVVEALDHGHLDSLREELGDLLFQVVFLSRLAQETGTFTAGDVVRGIGKKIVRRHPHVFGGATAENSAEVLRTWEEIKKQERLSNGAQEKEVSVLSGIPPALPALQKAQRLGTKAARVGFDWRRSEDILAKIQEEMAELRSALASGDREALGEEIGDLLFTVVNLARHTGTDAEAALEGSNRKFRARFQAVETELRGRGISIQDAGMELLDQLWTEAKSRTLPGGTS